MSEPHDPNRADEPAQPPADAPEPPTRLWSNPQAEAPSTWPAPAQPPGPPTFEAPSYQAPSPPYEAPSPSDQAPSPSDQAPSPSYEAPSYETPTYQAPSYQAPTYSTAPTFPAPAAPPDLPPPPPTRDPQGDTIPPVSAPPMPPAPPAPPAPPVAGPNDPTAYVPTPADPYAAQAYPPAADPYGATSLSPYAAAPASPYAAAPASPYGPVLTPTFDPVTGQPYSDKSKMIAALLQILPAVLLSVGGVGRLYAGNTNMGIIQLIATVVGWASFWCGFVLFFPFILWVGLVIWFVVDGILMFTGRPVDGQGRLLKPN
jgi:TM2 domain-containing membrane protein YozV